MKAAADVKSEIVPEVADVTSAMGVASLKTAFGKYLKSTNIFQFFNKYYYKVKTESTASSSTVGSDGLKSKKAFVLGGVPAPKCKVCKKSVYKMEEVSRFFFSHKFCYLSIKFKSDSGTEPHLA